MLIPARSVAALLLSGGAIFSSAFAPPARRVASRAGAGAGAASRLLRRSRPQTETAAAMRFLSPIIPSLTGLALASTSSPDVRVPPSDGGTSDANPLLRSWSTEPYHLPPFSEIRPGHFKPAFEVAMTEHLAELKSIADSDDDPTFDNVCAAYDRAGHLYGRVASVYGNLCGSLNTDEMREVQTEMTPILSRHGSAAVTTPGLFERIRAVHGMRDSLDLTPEQLRLVERQHLDFTRAGAHFDEKEKDEYAELKAELAGLCTEFTQNVMKDEEEYEMTLKREDLSGCPNSLVEAARQAAADREKGEEEYVVTLSRSLVEPFLTFSDRRDLRETAFNAWTKRGELFEGRDNIAIAEKILKLRKRQAEMHGYKTFAEYQCADTMAGTPEAVMNLLEDVWGRAKAAADGEREALEQYVKDSGEDLEGGIQPWDWRYYAEKVRVAKYDMDESELKPYLSLDAVTDAVMGVSNSLFGLRYVPKPDVKTYHPDVVTYEVRETTKDGGDELRAVFLHDNFARKFKSGGAWMSEYRSQTRNLPPGSDPVEGVPIVTNNNNFAKGSGPTLLSFDDASTLFHEMGHGHHGMLSDATYSRLSSTSVLRDFVELPSQLMERWLERPEVLKKYARHCETGEPIPDELIGRLKAAKNFNQGFGTIEYTACALLDMAMHMKEDYDGFDMGKFESEELDRLGMPRGIVMRHRPAHFSHLFSGGYYAACYYVYLWAEVLDADAFGAFEEAGDAFDADVAERLRRYIYSSGNTAPPDELFRKFRGRDPDAKFMLEKKGLAGAV